MLIGITGTLGEKARGAFARPCLMFLELVNKNIDKVYCAGTAPATQRISQCFIF